MYMAIRINLPLEDCSFNVKAGILAHDHFTLAASHFFNSRNNAKCYFIPFTVAGLRRFFT